MRGFILIPHQYQLEKRGFAVHRFSYPSWSEDLGQNARRLARFIAEMPASRIRLVAHSLGGLLALVMLDRYFDPRIDRLVMMGSPYAACHCGKYLADRRILSPFLGRSMGDWLSRPKPAIPESVEVGVIAGTRSWGLGRTIPGLPEPNDGVVALEETHLPGARDEIALPISHSGMLVSPNCARQVATFLDNGLFAHA